MKRVSVKIFITKAEALKEAKLISGKVVKYAMFFAVENENGYLRADNSVSAKLINE